MEPWGRPSDSITCLTEYDCIFLFLYNNDLRAPYYISFGTGFHLIDGEKLYKQLADMKGNECIFMKYGIMEPVGA